ncbi:MAG: 50S ribosomal protein L7Ae [Candidatus Odinarchaeota archaeon]
MLSKPHVKFTAPKELQDVAYEIIEVARDTGKVRKGTNETTKAVERAIAKFVAIAEDVDPPEIIFHLPIMCEEKNIPYIYVANKNRLGTALGIDVPSASAAVIEAGEAQRIIDDLVKKLKDLQK